MIVHRYSIPTLEIVRTLLDVGDCQEIQAVLVGENLVIDVLEPASVHSRTVAHAEEAAEPEPSQPEDQAPARKGGPLARRAAIACGERGFWTFLGVSTAEDAKADICRRCGITTRKMLDHDERAAGIWQDIDSKYGLWKEGYDVELDPVDDGDIGHD
jgi:hypothetical protein